VKNPNLFVIILNWNGRDVITECIDSLREVNYPPLRIVVVDNNSQDDSPQLVRDNYPEVEMIENEENLLFAAGNNVGIRYALQQGADYILLLNNDTEVDADFSRHLVDALDSDERNGIAGPKILYHHEAERIWYGGGGFYPLIWIPRHLNIRKSDQKLGQQRIETGYVSGCAMLIKREVIEDIGLLDSSYYMYCEDVDYCLRASIAGWKCVYEPSARVYHKVSASSGGGLTPYKLENRIVSTFRLFIKFRSPIWRFAVFPLHSLGFLVLCAVLLLRGKWRLLGACFRGAARVLGVKG
jgi:GT2 family glycosyltransferase